MVKTITQSDLQPQATPGDGWYVIEAWGEHPKTLDDGSTIIQVIDNEAVTAIVTAGIADAAGLLIDKDHISRDPERTTEAMGWSRDLAALIDDEGHYHLCGCNEWSVLGRPLIEGKAYKHYSTEYDAGDMTPLGGNRYRPTRLVGLALTNRPNNASGQPPITNRETTEPQTIPTPPTKMEELKAIAAKLGLPEDASKEDILAAIASLQDATATAQDAEAETILNSELADTDVPEDERDMLKEQLITNRERTLKIIKNRAAAAKKPAKPTPVYAGGIIKNRTGGVIPTQDKRGNAIALRDRAFEIQSKTGCDYFAATRIAGQELNGK